MPRITIDQIDEALTSLDALREQLESMADQLIPDATARTWSKRSQKHLKNINPALRRVCDRALLISPIDFTIIDGLRTLEEQKILLSKGKSKTMRSYHLVGRAVDFIPYISGKNRDNDLSAFAAVAKAFKMAAEELGERVTCGAIDWGWDYYHVQLEPYPVNQLEPYAEAR